MEQILYKLENFEGPLDLLLYLIDKNKIDIYDIPINTITDQYLEYMAKLTEINMDIESSFIVMATYLLTIKAKMMLPLVRNNEEEEDPREELVKRLLEYKKYKNLGHSLKDYEEVAPQYFIKEETIPKEVKQYIPEINYDELLKDLNLDRLKKIFIDVINKKENAKDILRSNFGTIHKERLPLRDKIVTIDNLMKENKKLNFKSYLYSLHSKEEVVVSFLAILELISAGSIKIFNENIDDDICLVYNDENNKQLDLSKVEDE